jgi:pimeloyl-ACP methyl ester carboxylesterase
MKIDTLEAVQVGDMTQWIRVRGADASNPVLLLIQQGPGLPMINEVRRFEQLLGLEREFTVVYWDQRGCGRTLRGRMGEAALRTVRGITATQSALLPELTALDLVHALPRLDVPFVMVQGRLDRVAPGDSAQQYFSSLVAPAKELVWFENSAHTPQLEEPRKSRELMMRIRADLLAKA